MLSEWTKRPGAENDDWERDLGAGTYCAVTQYAGSDDYCWHVHRAGARLHGVIRGREYAMQHADAIMALPVYEFNARAVAKLIDELREIETSILRLAPDAAVLPGYHAGFEDGAADTRRKILAVLNDEQSA